MANTATKAILRAYINDVLTDLMIKTTGDQVYLDATTTVAAKLAELVAAINLRAKLTDVEADIDELRQEILGDVPVEAYNTFTELAVYISEHQEAADALTAAIGNKADKSTVTALQESINALGELAKKSTISESDLDEDLKAKINAASSGNHSHSNQAVLDGITEENVTAWNGKSKFYAQATRPAGLTSNDLWAQIIT